jgi:hypothetical protein
MTDYRPTPPGLQVLLEMNSQPQISEPRRLSNWAPQAIRLTSVAALAPQSPPLTRTRTKARAGRLCPDRRAQVTGTMPGVCDHGTCNLNGDVTRALAVRVTLWL